MTAALLIQVSIQLALSVIAGVVAAFMTAQFALRRFYREKWWEARMQAYSRVIEALHHMRRDLEVTITAAEEGRDTDTEFHKALAAKNEAAWAEMRKTIDVGDFLLSSDAMRVLQQFFKEAEKANETDHWYEHLDTLAGAVAKCLPAMKVAARADLGLPAFKAKASS